MDLTRAYGRFFPLFFKKFLFIFFDEFYPPPLSLPKTVLVNNVLIGYFFTLPYLVLRPA